MFAIACAVLLCWSIGGAIKLLFKVSWGLTKGIAAILSSLALTLLVGYLLFINGMAVLFLVLLIAIAWVLFSACK